MSNIYSRKPKPLPPPKPHKARERKCLGKCKKLFWSTSSGRRICDACTHNSRYTFVPGVISLEHLRTRSGGVQGSD